jgi:general secretion pathway protein A
MYTRFFGLTEKPFAITPDPRYLYLSERHAEALSHLLYGINDAGGFVQLTGEVGTGKTTTIRSLLGQLPENADVALILNPRVTPEEFLRSIAEELRVPLPAGAAGSVKAIVDALNAFLLDAHARGRRVVVIVDEAQQLAADVLEQVRLLTNLETATQKLLQIILVGQPELREVLARNDLRQVAQRITGRYHLDPMSPAETAAYVRHRLAVAGATNEVFSVAALRELHRRARGVPRLVNVIADRALLGAYTREEHTVSAALVRHAAAEIGGGRPASGWIQWTLAGTAAVAALILCAALTLLFAGRGAAPERAAVAAPVAAVTRPPAPPPPPTVSEFLAANARDTGTDAAFGHLFAIWQAPFDLRAGRPCEQAAAAGLACFAGNGSFAQLRLLNRPAILSLVTGDGIEHQVVLAALGDATARLEAGGATLEADLLDLQRWWFGQYLLLWHPPAQLPHVIKPGMRGAAVRWLRQCLATARGEAAKGGSDSYDRELGLEVEEFQRAHRLNVDGIAGEQTLVILDALSGAPGSPTLRAGGSP